MAVFQLRNFVITFHGGEPNRTLSQLSRFSKLNCDVPIVVRTALQVCDLIQVHEPKQLRPVQVAFD